MDEPLNHATTRTLSTYNKCSCTTRCPITLEQMLNAIWQTLFDSSSLTHWPEEMHAIIIPVLFKLTNYNLVSCAEKILPHCNHGVCSFFFC